MLPGREARNTQNSAMSAGWIMTMADQPLAEARPLDEVGGHPARAHAVHVDVVRPDLRGERPGHAEHGVLGCTIGHLRMVAPGARHWRRC